MRDLMAHEHEHHEHKHEGFDVEVERQGPCVATVKFQVSAAEIQRTRDQGLKNLARRTRMKGFRPGKMPKQVLEKHFGKEVNREILQHFLNHAYQDAVQKHELVPAAHPRVDLEKVAFEPDQPFTYEFKLFLKPTIEIADYKGLSVEGQPITVADEEIEQTLTDLYKRNARPERSSDDGLEEEGMAVCHLSFRIEDQAEPVLDREGIRLSPKTPPPGVDAKEFEGALLGLKEGETRTLAVETYPPDFPEEAARGKKGSLDVEATEVYRFVPPADEEVFKAFEVEDQDGLKKALSERIREAKSRQEEQRVETALLERLIAETEIALPDELIEERADLRVQELRNALKDSEGLDADEIERRLTEERAQARESQAKAMRALYVIEEIAKKEELLVKEADLRDELIAIAERNGSTFDEVRKYYREQGLIQQLGIELLERKVRSFLRESADIQVAS